MNEQNAVRNGIAIGLAAFIFGLVSAYTYFALKSHQSIIAGLENNQQEYQVDRYKDFKQIENTINLLEDESHQDLLLESYHLAYLNIKAIDADAFADRAGENITGTKGAFYKRYAAFLAKTCKIDQDISCTYYGQYLLANQQYDEAYDALIGRAKRRDDLAISALVDLYRTSAWAKASEKIAREWLFKLGE